MSLYLLCNVTPSRICWNSVLKEHLNVKASIFYSKLQKKVLKSTLNSNQRGPKVNKISDVIFYKN